MWSSYNCIQFSNEKGIITGACYVINEPQKCYAIWNNPYMRSYIIWTCLYAMSKKDKFIVL